MDGVDLQYLLRRQGEEVILAESLEVALNDLHGCVGKPEKYG